MRGVVVSYLVFDEEEDSCTNRNNNIKARSTVTESSSLICAGDFTSPRHYGVGKDPEPWFGPNGVQPS